MVLQGDFAWDIEAGPAVSDLDLKVPVGSLVTIVGQTGSGKSSLLSAALGLMNQVQGPAPEVHGKVRRKQHFQPCIVAQDETQIHTSTLPPKRF